MGVSKNSGAPKWMVKIRETPIKVDDLGVFPLFLERPILLYHISTLKPSILGWKPCGTSCAASIPDTAPGETSARLRQNLPDMCHGQKSRFLGDKLIPPLMTESLFHGALFSPLRNWVDDHPLLYGNNGSLDPGTYRGLS